MPDIPSRSEATSLDYHGRLERVLRHIQDHLDETLGLAELAEVACFSPFHFHRIFTGMMGETVAEHVRRLRMERAATVLRVGRKSVTEVALDSGYEATESFTRAFKAAYGLAPVRFRASPREVRLSASSGVQFGSQTPPKLLKPKPTGIRTMNVSVKTIEPLRVAFLRHTGHYSNVGQTWADLVGQLGPRGHLSPTTALIGIPYDDPETVAAEKCRNDACVTVDEGYRPSGAIKIQTIPGGDYAVARHKGPPETIGETYALLFARWLPQSKREPRAEPCLLIAANNFSQVDRAERETDIYLPLQPKAGG